MVLKTELDQQFTKLFAPTEVKSPPAIFDDPVSELEVVAKYRMLDGKKYRVQLVGVPQPRADGRHNYVFPGSSRIERER